MPAADLLALLAHPNIRSKESIVRVFDHEVKGATAVKPFVGVATSRARRRSHARARSDLEAGLVSLKRNLPAVRRARSVCDGLGGG